MKLLYKSEAEVIAVKNPWLQKNTVTLSLLSPIKTIDQKYKLFFISRIS